MAILKSTSSSVGQGLTRTSVQSDAVQAAVAAKARAAATAAQNQMLLNSGFRGVGISPYIGTPTYDNPVVTKPSSNTTKTETLPRDDTSPYVAPYVPPPPPPPPLPPTAKDLGVVKTPGRDVFKISDLVQQTPSDTIKRIAFEQLSAIELSQVLTSNTVDGVNQKYSIISNLSDIKRIFDASKQLSIMNKLSPMTGVFTIDLDSKIPGEKYLLADNLYSTNSYIDIDGVTQVDVEKGYVYIDTNGDLVIEFDNVRNDEIVQIQIVANGTIYEVT